MTEREFATDVVRRLQTAGYAALFAGGCVRDELLGREPADFDIATSARPEQVKPLFRKCHFFGASFGVVEVLGPKSETGEWLKVQVATFRTDGIYSDGRRPDGVVFSSPEHDAARRDFTVNGLFYDPIADRVIDYVGGRADLKSRILRAIGDPALRFIEDKLRLLRAARMAARFELAIDPATAEAIRAMASQIHVVSAERIAEEMRKLLENEHRIRGVRLLRELDLLKEILPEANTDSQALAAMPASAKFPMIVVGLCSGAPESAFPGIVRRWKLSNEERDRILWLAKHRRALEAAPEQPRSLLFPVLAHSGIRDLLALAPASSDSKYCRELLQNYPPEEFDPPVLITGDDVQEMGYQPGKEFKTWLGAIRALQLDGVLKSADDARAKVRALAAATSA